MNQCGYHAQMLQQLCSCLGSVYYVLFGSPLPGRYHADFAGPQACPRCTSRLSGGNASCASSSQALTAVVSADQVAGGGPGSPTGMRCRIPTPASSTGAAQSSPEANPGAPPRQQQLGAPASPAGLISPFASPRTLPEPGGPAAEWDELVGDAADGELEGLVAQMMLSSTLRLFDGGADAAIGAAGLGSGAAVRVSVG